MAWTGKRAKLGIWILVIAVCGGALGAYVFFRLAHRQGPLLIGAVMRQDSDPQKEQPLAQVMVTELNGLATGPSYSDASGFFHLRLRRGVRRGEAITLAFRHPDYHPLDLNQTFSDQIYLAHMVPLVQKPAAPQSEGPVVVVSNVSVRYSAKNEMKVNVGGLVTTFEVKNTANTPCNGRHPCSPDGKWKATVGSTSLDAGAGNVFQNVRVTCIAGPCPFTKIDRIEATNKDSGLTVTARSWAGNATFLVEAEIVHPMISNMNRQSYPAIFGQAFNFSLPPLAEGVSIQAEINGESIVFPLGPNLKLSWAHCIMSNEKDQARVYRCELKPGYRFG